MKDSLLAVDIHQEILDRTGTAMMTGDFAAFRVCFTLPTVFETFETRREVTSEAELRAVFDRVTENRRVQRVQDMARRCIMAEFRDPETIAATHETRYIYIGNILAPVISAGFSVLRLQDGLWKVASSQYSVDGDNALNRALSVR